MSTLSLGRLERVPLRSAWLSEAQDFTPWLAQAENLTLLSKILEMDLELEAQETRVGPFRADILCRDLANGSWVLIENQLERTDHSHLGQLLTYAAGLSAVSIIWIAERFTDEHRAALDWLNEKTPEEIGFFGLEVELWRIGTSPVAPKFNVVSKPNAWTRQVIHQRDGNTEQQQLCLDFWDPVYALAQKKGLPIRVVKPLRRKDTPFDVGWRTFRLKAYFSTVKKASSAWVSCRGPKWLENFEHLQSHRAEIEAAFGGPLVWKASPDLKQATVSSEIEGFNGGNRDTWDQHREIIADRLVRLHRAVSSFLEPLDVEPGESEDTTE
jgi:Domain of unknown function (DUF4268)